MLNPLCRWRPLSCFALAGIAIAGNIMSELPSYGIDLTQSANSSLIALSDPIPLWSGTAPDEKGDIGAEHDTTPEDPKIKPEDRIIRLGNVTRPTITIYRPAKEKDTGATVVVCPGGGYYILAMDLEGTEICRWLNSLGVTAISLKYRVPARNGRERYAAALQDAQRAVGIVRHRAREWGIDPKRIGVLGFSAGGHLCAALSANSDRRTYPIADDADRESCRPDFTLLIYPAYLNQDKNPSLVAPEVSVTANTPPTFLLQTEDDDLVTGTLGYSMALKRAGVPLEMHIFSRGGHGYGLRPSANPVSDWPRLAGIWMKSSGFLNKP